MDQVSQVSLRDYADRLRRLYNLSGDIRTLLDFKINPVVIADDLQRPGLSTGPGRRFRLAYHTAAATTIFEKYRFNFNCVLTRVQGVFTALSAGPVVGRIIPPLVADAGVTYSTPATQSWVENLASTTDRPNIERATNGVAGLGTLMWYSAPASTSSPSVDMRDLHMPAGSVLHFANAGVETTTNWLVSLEGYAL